MNDRKIKRLFYLLYIFIFYVGKIVIVFISNWIKIMNKNIYRNFLVCENKEKFIYLFMRLIEVRKYFFNNVFVFCYFYSFIIGFFI